MVLCGVWLARSPETRSQDDQTVSRQAESQPTREATAVSQQIRELRIERRDVLATAAELASRSFQVGDAELSLVLETSDQLLQAELELARTQPERVRVLEKRLTNMQHMHEAIAARFDSGHTSQHQVLASRAAVLRIKIELAIAKAEIQEASDDR